MLVTPEQQYVMDRIKVLTVTFFSVSLAAFFVFGTVVITFYFLFPIILNVNDLQVLASVQNVLAMLFLRAGVTPSSEFVKLVLYNLHLYVFFVLELSMLYVVGCTGLLLWKEWGRKVMLWVLPVGALNVVLGTSVCVNLTYVLPKTDWLAENPFITDVQRALFVVLLLLALVFHGWYWGLLKSEESRELFE